MCFHSKKLQPKGNVEASIGATNFEYFLVVRLGCYVQLSDIAKIHAGRADKKGSRTFHLLKSKVIECSMFEATHNNEICPVLNVLRKQYDSRGQ